MAPGEALSEEKRDRSFRTMIRMSGLAAILAGFCLAGFVLVHPWDQLLGAQIAQTVRWQLAHALHFVGALFALLGLLGIFARQRGQLGPFGLAGFILSFIGNAMFLGTGMITAFIWPMLAVHAPATVEPGGAIFGWPHSVLAFALTAVILSTGYVIFGIAMLRARVFPRLSILMLVTGAILGMLPPHPVGALPWGGLVFGGVLYGAALVWIGSILWTKNS
jgi:hypothetical protein